MSECESSPKYPVKLVHHYNRYAGHLLDVDGDVLRGDSGDALNVFKEELKDMMESGRIRFIHYMEKEPTYAYFIISEEQWTRFKEEREEGSSTPYTKYHVYIDP